MTALLSVVINEETTKQWTPLGAVVGTFVARKIMESDQQTLPVPSQA